jgi:hypothetical protein
MVVSQKCTLAKKGLYKHRIIQAAVNVIWFKGKCDEGIKYPEFYNPIPEVGLALILTVVSPVQFIGPFQIY